MRALLLLMATTFVAVACSGTEPGSIPPASNLPVDTASGVLPSSTCWEAHPDGAAGAAGPIRFLDATEELGLVDPLLGMHAHAAAWADINGDLRPDLLVGTFADRPESSYQQRGAPGPSPDRLLVSGDDGFTVWGGFPEPFGRTSGAAFGDLDGDGDPDLVVARNFREGQGLEPTTVYENDAGSFVAVDSGIPVELGGRSVGLLDYDGDGALDLFIAEDRYQGGRSRLFRNIGDLRFEDVTTDAGLPDGLAGLGVATGDVDGDADVDLFVAGDNRLFIDDGVRFVEASGPFGWPPVGDEDDPAGAAFGDVDRDGRLDLVVGQHFNSTVDFGVPAPVRLFLNRTDPAGPIVFEEITERAGLVPLPTKAPHVEIADVDNDGWPDIVTSASAADGRQPAIFRGVGVSNGVPRFEAPQGLGDIQYWVAAPAADVDLDGRLDLLLVEFDPSLPSLLLRNDTESGNWLQVSLGPTMGGGIGARVFAFGAAGQPDAGEVLGSTAVTASAGYAAGVPAVAHLGLGDARLVDVLVRFPDGTELAVSDVPANRHLRIGGPCR